MILSEAAIQLGAAGWRVERLPAPRQIPDALESRLSRVPRPLLDELMSLALLTNRDETAWFLCAPDYDGTGESAFRWDELERMSLEAVGDDEEEAERVAAFWRRHLPFLLSVKSGYSYFALCLEGPNEGRVVHGVEPDFEEAVALAESIEEFLATLVAVARGEREESVIRAAV